MGLPIRRFLRKWEYNREIQKAKKFTEDTAAGFWELYNEAITFHGRYRLSKIISAADQRELDVDDKVLSLYKIVMMITPYKTYAILN